MYNPQPTIQYDAIQCIICTGKLTEQYWTCGLQLADIPPPQSATLGLHPVDRKLLLICRPAQGRRLSLI